MANKEKIIKELKEALDSLDITNKYRLNLIRAIEYLKEESVSDDLEEAAKEQARSYGYMTEDYEFKENVESFKTGAQWRKKQMMAKAVDGVVTFDYYKGDKTYGCIAHDSFCLEDLGLKDTDKVKMIIVKDEMSKM